MVQVIQSTWKWVQGSGLGFSHEEVLGNLCKSSDREGRHSGLGRTGEWTPLGRLTVKVGGAGLKETVVVPLRDF